MILSLSTLLPVIYAIYFTLGSNPYPRTLTDLVYDGVKVKMILPSNYQDDLSYGELIQVTGFRSGTDNCSIGFLTTLREYSSAAVNTSIFTTSVEEAGLSRQMNVNNAPQPAS
jgi:hypothetical protein